MQHLTVIKPPKSIKSETRLTFGNMSCDRKQEIVIQLRDGANQHIPCLYNQTCTVDVNIEGKSDKFYFDDNFHQKASIGSDFIIYLTFVVSVVCEEVICQLASTNLDLFQDCIFRKLQNNCNMNRTVNSSLLTPRLGYCGSYMVNNICEYISVVVCRLNTFLLHYSLSKR